MTILKILSISDNSCLSILYHLVNEIMYLTFFHWLGATFPVFLNFVQFGFYPPLKPYFVQSIAFPVHIYDELGE